MEALEVDAVNPEECADAEERGVWRVKWKQELKACTEKLPAPSKRPVKTLLLCMALRYRALRRMCASNSSPELESW